MPAARNNQKSDRVQRCTRGVTKPYKKSATMKVGQPQIKLQLPQSGTFTEGNASQRWRTNAVTVANKPKRHNPKVRHMGRVMQANVNAAQREHEAKLMEFAKMYYWRYEDLARMERETKRKSREIDQLEEEAKKRDEESKQRDERSKRREERSKQKEQEVEAKAKEGKRREEKNAEVEKQQRIIGTLLKNQKRQQDRRRKDLDYERDVVWQLKEKLEKKIGGGQV